MLMVIAAASDVPWAVEILLELLGVLFGARMWILTRRHRGIPDGWITTVSMVVLYALIIACVAVLFFNGALKLSFVGVLLLADLLLWIYFPVRDGEDDDSIKEATCDLCLEYLYGSGEPHVVGSHTVCGKCHETIEEAKRDEGV